MRNRNFKISSWRSNKTFSDIWRYFSGQFQKLQCPEEAVEKSKCLKNLSFQIFSCSLNRKILEFEIIFWQSCENCIERLQMIILRETSFGKKLYSKYCRNLSEKSSDFWQWFLHIKQEFFCAQKDVGAHSIEEKKTITNFFSKFEPKK